MANKKIKKLILEVVDNQLKRNDPPCTREALEQLLSAGYTQKEAKEKIGAVVLEEIYDILKEGREFDEQEYAMALEDMVEQCIDYEDCHHISDEWDEISELIQAGYEASKKNKYPVMTRKWMKAWELVKQMVVQDDTRTSIRDLDEETDYAYDLSGWLQDMEMKLLNAGEHEKRLQFCTEILRLFVWEDNNDWDVYMEGGFQVAVGESLYALGRKEEAQNWFIQWLEKTPHDTDAIAGYSRYLMSDGKAENAYKMLKDEIEGLECTCDNDILFLCLIECTEQLGKTAERDIYQKKYDQFKDKVDAEMEAMEKRMEENWTTPFFDRFSPADPVQQTVVKGAKIYPNDPCPCGSGKKYKKCCGRK